jgi:hypothetical protein
MLDRFVAIQHGHQLLKGIRRSLLTAIASAAGVGEGGCASAGFAEDLKMPSAPVLRSSATAEGGAARGASLGDALWAG